MKAVDEFVKELKELGLDVHIGGSYAKNTHLENDFDVDLFVKFPIEDKGKDISKILEEKLKKFKYERLKGSRDYFRVEKNKHIFEIVPVLEVNEKAENITDYSLDHVEWVNENVRNKDDVRKLKLFLKANKLYGAESHIQGFSGYVCEILIAYYKTFDNLIRKASKWKKNKVVDINKFYENIGDVYNSLNQEKIGKLIVIDPTDKDRNTVSALSDKNYFKFIKLSKDYLENPKEKFFEKKEFNIKKIRTKKNEKLIYFTKKIGNVKRDGAKVMKVYNQIKKLLERNEFKIEKSEFEVLDKGYIWFVIKEEELSEKVKHYGPSVRDKANLESFKKKWKNIEEENGKVYTYADREFKNIKEIEKYIKKEFELKR
jgi:tRNA nucleotidyltransferase (CCA-adding enzyme)